MSLKNLARGSFGFVTQHTMVALEMVRREEGWAPSTVDGTDN